MVRIFDAVMRESIAFDGEELDLNFIGTGYILAVVNLRKVENCLMLPCGAAAYEKRSE